MVEPWIETNPHESVALVRREGRIVGSCCVECGQAAFPPVRVCRNCRASNLEERTFADHGNLYSYTVVHVSSARAVPYAVGYVDLADGLRVLGDLDISPDALACDTQVRLRNGPTGWAFHSSETNP
ncbi:Zn-ribbon domain-containing OB-fold protein [Antrihabitans sp. YC2-6]|uniref:Zn-ribbon domain-containing OB-fold protein n=1 Tax=Antrihabitans sp. YC2-6 TaxID=2799498 RepID=UPI0018F70388|nr:OB-fold domain-containing protein [Antrihabitans sp. YC2-6]MBJ8346951.1 OB-fold domain-containing protein [Antrihabitans sp. YC2-6]